MSGQLASRLEQYFGERTDNGLRSIVRYDNDSFEVEYIRDDVKELYDEGALIKAIDESRFETLSAPIYERVFDDDHGDLICMVHCFENVLEMNFLLEDGVGVAVGLESETLNSTSGLVGDVRKIVVEERAER